MNHMDSATQAFVQRVSDFQFGESPARTVEEMRARTLQNDHRYSALDFSTEHTIRRVQVRDGGVLRIDEYAPAEEPIGVILYFHGGGWVLGEQSYYEGLARRLAVLTGCRVLVSEYRKAPEYRFPTAAQDALDVFAEVTALLDAEETRLPLVVMGDSAGGNLAAVVTQQVSVREPEQIALQILVYPILSASFDSESYRSYGRSTLLTSTRMRWFWDQYVPDHADRRNPLVSPLDSGEIVPTAPTLVLLAERDVLYSEGAAYAKKLARAGTRVKSWTAPGQIHSFFTLQAPFPYALHAWSAIGVEIRAQLGQAAPLPAWTDV